MYININNRILLSALSKIDSVIDKSPVERIYSHVKLSQQGSEQLIIIATDQTIEVTQNLPTNGGEEGEAVLIFKTLYDICKYSYKEEMINISTNKNENEITVKNANGSYRLQTIPVDDFPTYSTEEAGTTLNINAQVFAKLIGQTAYAMANSDPRYYLNALLIDFSTTCLRAVATDGHRIVMAETAVENSVERSILIPRKTIYELSKFLGDKEADLAISFGLQNVVFSLEGVTLRSKLVDGNYPKYQKVFPKGLDKNLTLVRGEFADALKKVSFLHSTGTVQITLATDKMSISSSNMQNETGNSEMPIDYQGEELVFGINANYLYDVFNSTDHERLQISFKDTNSGCLIEQTEENVSSKCLIMFTHF